MKNKQEILVCAIEAYNATVNDMSKFALDRREESVFGDAMNEYAKEVHFGFKNWVNEIVAKGGYRMEKMKELSDEQLFDIFIAEIEI